MRVEVRNRFSPAAVRILADSVKRIAKGTLSSATLVQVSFATTPKLYPFGAVRPTISAADGTAAPRKSGEHAGKGGPKSGKTPQPAAVLVFFSAGGGDHGRNS
jgi:hypothetical protein